MNKQLPGPFVRRVNVMRGFSEIDVWRPAIPSGPLHVFSTDGPLDAPEWSPCGGMRSTPSGPWQIISDRDGHHTGA